MQAILEIGPSSITSGIYTDKSPQYTYHSPTPLFPASPALLNPEILETHFTQIHVAVRLSLEKLLLSATKTHVVVLEPPLFPMQWKNAVARAVLAEIRALSLTFLSWAACLCVSQGVSGALVDTTFSGVRYVVPVYDHRELTHWIRSDSEDADAMTQVLQLLPRDVHDLQALGPGSAWVGKAWVGAAIVCQNNKLNGQVSRARYLRDGVVGDALMGPA